MTTSVADEISMDGTKPPPSAEELIAMERVDLVSMLADAHKRSMALKLEIANATRDRNWRHNPITYRRVDAMRHARDWHIHLSQLVQRTLSLIRDAEKDERLELSISQHESDARNFVRAARRILSPELYRAVWDETRREPE